MIRFQRQAWFDVDAYGMLTALAILAAAWLLAIVPLQHAQLERRTANSAWRQGQQRRAQQQAELAAVQAESEELRRELTARFDRMPGMQDWNNVVAEVVRRAAESGLELSKVQPDSPRVTGLAAFADIDLGGAGELHEILSFLQALALDLPGCQVRSLTVQAQGHDLKPCKIGLIVRVPLLAERPKLTAEPT